MSLERRLELVAEAGIDVAIVQPFTRDFAAIDAPAFVRDVLARDLGARDAVVGYDFSFGQGRAGNAAMLGALGAAVDIEVAVIPPISVDGQACSSSRIRELVQAGDTNAAARLLGRPFELEGAVVRGAGRGRGLGFPTANVAPEAELRPRLGIYAARARVLDGPLAGTVFPLASGEVTIGRAPPLGHHRQYCGVLHAFHADIGLHVAYARYLGERINAEVAKLIEVAKNHPQHIVPIARQQVALEHLRVFQDLFLKSVHGRAGLPVEPHFDNGLQRLAGRCRVHDRDVTLNDAAAFEQFQPAQTGRWRETNALGEVLV